MIDDWKNGPHLLTCRQTEPTFGLAADALATDAPDRLPPDRLQHIRDDLLEASIPGQFKHASTAPASHSSRLNFANLLSAVLTCCDMTYAATVSRP